MSSPSPNPILPPLPGGRRPRVFDVGLVGAISWLLLAVGVTLVWGPVLGLRGWIWLLAHHFLCVLGCTHELRRAWRRRKQP